MNKARAEQIGNGICASYPDEFFTPENISRGIKDMLVSEFSKLQVVTANANLIPVEYNAEHDIITASGINYDNFKEFSKRVLEFNGKTYVFLGWNSDLGKCYFKQGAAAAIIGRKRR